MAAAGEAWEGQPDRKGQERRSRRVQRLISFTHTLVLPQLLIQRAGLHPDTSAFKHQFFLYPGQIS
jgi:hypothetical protein